MGGLLRLLKLALGLLVALFGLALVLAWIVPLPAGPDTDPRLLASPGTRFVTVPPWLSVVMRTSVSLPLKFVLPR